jgi:hypothetical protein
MRKRFSIDQIIKILAEAETPGNSVAATARKYGISRNPTAGVKNIVASPPPKLNTSSGFSPKTLASNVFLPKKNSKSRP